MSSERIASELGSIGSELKKMNATLEKIESSLSTIAESDLDFRLRDIRDAISSARP